MYPNSRQHTQVAHQAGFVAPAHPQAEYSGQPASYQQPNINEQAAYPHHSYQGVQQGAAGVTEPEKNRSYLQVTAYGSKCAVQCEPATSQSGWFTVGFEAAKKASTNPNDRKYNWRQKLSLQLTQSELPYFIAFAYGLLPSIRFENHGDVGKWIEIELQAQRYYVKLGSNQKDSLHAIPVGFADLAMFGAIALRQYSLNFGISADAALEGIKVIANLAYNAGAYPAARK